MNQPTQSENEPRWKIPLELLTSLSGPEFEVSDGIINPEWVRYQHHMFMGDSEAEKNEKKQAIQEQLRLGILKLKQSPEKTKLVAKGPITQELKKFADNLKIDPNKIEKQNNFRPKIQDNKGQIRKLGPNDKCPCGSGKKYKKCHGRGQF
jgi:uncharacterized protein YecA (UPF0149 family)